ncbi:efflux RND transporter periplasmic adaptor subunit [Deltaproteobacteria bacterium TL4]
MRPNFHWLWISIVLFSLTSQVWGQDPSDAQAIIKNGYRIEELKLTPNPPAEGKQEFGILLLNEQKQPLTDAVIEVELLMPAMPGMAAVSIKAQADHQGKGRYRAQLKIPFNYSWELPIRVKRPQDASATEFPFGIAVGVDDFTYTGKRGGGTTINEQSSVYLSQPRQQLIGVSVGKVERQEISREIRTIARLDVDESHVSDVVLKYSGYIEKLYASRAGDYLEKGQPMFKIYSPEVYTAQTEYLQLIRVAGADAARTGRKKLLLWDFSEEQITALSQSGQVERQQTIASPISGFILKKNLVMGSFVNAGMQLYQIADLSKLWAVADIFEHEVSLIKQGDLVTLRLAYGQGQAIQAKIAYIYPTVETTTRTIKVRIEVDNPGYRLRPGMYADATLQTQSEKRLVIPRRAVLFSGKHKYVFRVLGDGYFEPKEIQTGLQTEEWFEVLEGLEEGDAVSFSANFLISSEAQLRNVLPQWGTPLVPSPAEIIKENATTPVNNAPASGHAGHGQ